MASDALASQRVSSRRARSSTVAKYFEPVAAGRPSGLSSPTETNTGMSFSPKPSSQAVSLIPSRAGGVVSERKSFFAWFMLHLSFQNCLRLPTREVVHAGGLKTTRQHRLE